MIYFLIWWWGFFCGGLLMLLLKWQLSGQDNEQGEDGVGHAEPEAPITEFKLSGGYDDGE